MSSSRPDRPLCITLTDNGSLRPEATFSLRCLARAMTERTGQPVHPVSLLHSNKIDAAKLEGEPASIFEKFALAQRANGLDAFLVLPLFFGPSAAIAEYLPQRVEAMRETHAWPELQVLVAPCLVNRDAPEDRRVAEILADHVRDRLQGLGRGAPGVSVALVDHGSPRIAVTEVRNLLAHQLAILLGDEVQAVARCSMERRDGPEYDFNEPLLERLLGQPGFEREVIVSMLFLQPGRHAGAGGDVAEICQTAEEAVPGLATHMTELVGSHPALLDLLVDRLAEATAGACGPN